ncbi:MAG TPA: AmmeMemoRadiSam system protein A [Candidatus Binatia bacterium]|nr:AmmeMemoRadiSam system protein A [Candidatus Binatia bacterium]
MAPDWTPLTITEQWQLLRRARDSIAAALRAAAPPQMTTPTSSLAAPNGVFVSLHIHTELRGCVGILTTDQPLHESVARLAIAAAFDDPRFAPLSDAELDDLDIEISRLTDPLQTHPGSIVVGRDGVCIRHGDRRAVLLPQVAPMYGWDRERLLTELCRKAALHPDAWRQPPTELFRFEAEVFSERSLGGYTV